MSDFFNATINNEFFYILPICNLPCDAQGTALDDQFVDSDMRGARSSTNTLQNFSQYNDNFESLSPILIIPDYIKNLNPDYISFSVTTDGTTVTNLAHIVYSISLKLVYKLVNGINPFITGDNIEYNLNPEDNYDVHCKFSNGVLYPIDLSSIYGFTDIAITTSELVPAPTASPDKNNKSRPYNITLWKKFIKQDPANRFSFLKQNSLPATYNTYIG